jgi:hypothetical protein
MNRRQRNLLILLGVLVLAAGGFFLLTRGGGDEEQAAVTTPAAPAPPAAAAPGVPAEGEEENPLAEPPKVFRFFGGRDPFVQLVVAEAGASGVETAAATTGEAPPPPAPVAPAPVGAEEDAQGQAVTVDQKRVTLVDVVDEDTAQVEVATEEFKVDEGDRFAKYFELVSVDATCTRLLFGDVAFELCKGGAR